MHFKLTHDLPRECVVAVSGGMDSISALHFLLQTPGKVKRVAHVNHGTGSFADSSQVVVERFCESVKIPLDVYHIDTIHPPPEKSLEEHWRDERYRKLEEASQNSGGLPVVLAHNLDDCLENYVKSTMLDGHLGTIPYRRGACIRPFRLWKRSEIEAYSRKHLLPSIEDPANYDYTRFQRAKIRRLVIPRIKFLNPGVYKVVEKAIKLQDIRDRSQTQ